MADLEFKLEIIRENIQRRIMDEYRDEQEARKNGFDDLAEKHKAFQAGASFAERQLYLLEPTEE